MATINVALLPLIIDVAARSVEVDTLDRRRLEDLYAYRGAIRSWQHVNKLYDHVPKDSAKWEEAQQATAGEYGVLKDSKRQVKNARSRLANAVRKLRAAGFKP